MYDLEDAREIMMYMRHDLASDDRSQPILNGSRPLSPESLLKSSIRPALASSTGRHRGQTNRLAQLQPFASDEFASNKRVVEMMLPR
jgi:hypothetical protein